MLRRLTYAAVVIALAASLAGCGESRLALSQVSQGVSRHRLEGKPVVVFRRERSVRVFLADVHHLKGEEKALVWCPSERLLITETHAEAFDEEGEVVGGPASRGLDEIPVRFDRGFIVRDGPVEPGVEASKDLRSFEHLAPWDAGAGTFCEGKKDL